MIKLRMLLLAFTKDLGSDDYQPSYIVVQNSHIRCDSKVHMVAGKLSRKFAIILGLKCRKQNDLLHVKKCWICVLRTNRIVTACNYPLF